jgi:hypothetical protein
MTEAERAEWHRLAAEANAKPKRSGAGKAIRSQSTGAKRKSPMDCKVFNVKWDGVDR